VKKELRVERVIIYVLSNNSEGLFYHHLLLNYKLYRHRLVVEFRIYLWRQIYIFATLSYTLWEIVDDVYYYLTLTAVREFTTTGTTPILGILGLQEHSLDGDTGFSTIKEASTESQQQQPDDDISTLSTCLQK
jgi:hypothetical protein